MYHGRVNIMKRGFILWLLLVFLILQSCQASQGSFNAQPHDPSLYSSEAERSMHATLRRGGKVAGGKGANGGSDMIRQPKNQRSGGCSMMLKSLSPLFPAASVAIMQLLFLDFPVLFRMN
ncbi:hypothetical protein LINPERHAP1_LOCUS26327 [Linum perenne]